MHSTSGCAAIRATWGAECDQLLFISDRYDPALPAVRLAHEGPEAYVNMWQKVRAAWMLLYRDFVDDFDFFLMGGDDLYVLVPNLRHLLRTHDGDGEPLYLGRRMRQVPWSGWQGNGQGGQLFNSGGAGYVLNAAALRLLGPELAKPLARSPACSAHAVDSAEDVRVATCLASLGVRPADTRDAAGEERFHPFHPGDMATTNLDLHSHVPGSAEWFARYVHEFRPRTGINCCSRWSVSFHYMTPRMQEELHSLLETPRAQSLRAGAEVPPPVVATQLPSPAPLAPYMPAVHRTCRSRPVPAPSIPRAPLEAIQQQQQQQQQQALSCGRAGWAATMSVQEPTLELRIHHFYRHSCAFEDGMELQAKVTRIADVFSSSRDGESSLWSLVDEKYSLSGERSMRKAFKERSDKDNTE